MFIRQSIISISENRMQKMIRSCMQMWSVTNGAEVISSLKKQTQDEDESNSV